MTPARTVPARRDDVRLLAVDPAAGVYFVDDGSNTLNLLHH